MELHGPEQSADRSLLQQTQRLHTLNEISRVLSSALDLGTLYETMYQQVGRVMDTSQFFVALHRPEQKVIEIPYLRESGKLSLNLEVPYGNTVTSTVISRGVPFLFHTPEGFLVYARANSLPDSIIVGSDDSESGIFVPLNTGSRTIGAMTVQSKRPHAYSDDDVQTLLVIAAQAAVAIENARLYQQSQESVRQMEALLGAAQAITSSLELRTVLDTILERIRDVVPYFFAAILLPDHSKSQLNVASTVGPLSEEQRRTLKIPFGQGITGTAFQSGEPLVVPDVQTFSGYIDHGIKEIRCELALPLKRGEVVVGVLDVEREESEAFSGEDLDLLSLFASQAAIAIENA
ncbi:MAG TPA: GAF domain-containing protein, partial [Chloroflexota bacterium]